MTRSVRKLKQVEDKVMDGLKDFQVATVDRIYHLYKTGQRRVLVADEVGLGKTLIARGTVAKLARLCRKNGNDLFKVVYICSNEAIADQNLNKLRITRDDYSDSSSSSRLSMQHLNIFRQEYDKDYSDSYIQLIPLTPDTSFRTTKGAGKASERALMFVILRRLPELRRYIDALDTLLMDRARVAWDFRKEKYEERVDECNRLSKGKYLEYMKLKLKKKLECEWKDGVTYIRALLDLCNRIKSKRGKRDYDSSIIGQLRVIFAKISLEKLNPDLVIMDEFQRFKYLLYSDPNTETGMLADKFFHSKKVRLLLLSATPYKMYSTLEEIDETRNDEHYTEFLSVMKFLNEEARDEREFMTVWKDYSIKLKEMTFGDTTILEAKDAAEAAMYQTVCRTERISASETADIIDDSDVHEPIEVSEADIRSYIEAQELLDYIGVNYHVPVDYIKSTPYIMSFMRDYQLKRDVEKYFRKNPDETGEINKPSLWLDRSTIANFDEIPNNNARLDRVMKATLQDGEENLLWIPPSKPYYKLQGAFECSELTSKTLIFSSWEMVPRMLASLISYEAERRTVGKVSKHYRDGARYFYNGEKRYPPARLNFSVTKGVCSGMNLFCLIYPSQFLSDCYDPIECMNKDMSLRNIKKQIKAKITKRLGSFSCKMTAASDKRWYYLAPLLMDEIEHVRDWLESRDKLAEIDIDEKHKRSKGFDNHLSNLRNIFEETLEADYRNLGRQPDDLADVLTDMAIASPAICINRTYKMYVGDSEDLPVFYPSQLARVFINRMNTAEATAVVEIAHGRQKGHWRNLLSYCVDGNLQAVFDEYAHIIAGGADRDDALIENMHVAMMEAMNIRTTQYTVDTYNSFRSRMWGQKERPTNIRTHFAVAFTKGDGDEKDTDRKTTLRNAFNSPFRPFVLATTSIGQEGLDFHNYCRRIVHWNLPSNPIDLEQREGRINRYKCLAIRQNVAKRYGDIYFSKDIWDEMFDEASKKEKRRGSSDLIPFWGLRKSDDMVKIERIVPMYPFSRDRLSYERLMKIYSYYRLTLGQARQEELLEYLFKNCNDPKKLKELFINLSPFYKE